MENKNNKFAGAWVFDTESDSLARDATKIHNLYAVNTKTKEDFYTTDYEVMKEFFTTADTLICHNLVTHDCPLVEKVLGVKITATKVDTLAISYYLHSSNPEILKNGLEAWGERLGIPKVKVQEDEWVGAGEEKESIIKYYEGLNK